MSDDRVTILGGKIDALEQALSDQVDVIKALRDAKAKQQERIVELRAALKGISDLVLTDWRLDEFDELAIDIREALKDGAAS